MPCTHPWHRAMVLLMCVVIAYYKLSNEGRMLTKLGFVTRLQNQLATQRNATVRYNIIISAQEGNGNKDSFGGTIIHTEDTSCHINKFDDYYQNEFFNSIMVPFDSWCLKQLIQLYPDNLDLRVAHVRRQYFERMSTTPAPNNQTHMHSRHMIWYCRGNGCGGHGDRLRGMARVFYYALAFNATFTIFVEYPRWDDYFLLLDDLELIGRQSLFHSLVLDDVVVRSGSSKNYTFNTSRLPPERTVHVSEMCSVSTIQDYESALFPIINENGVARDFGVAGGTNDISATQYAIFETNQFLVWGEGGTRSNPLCNVNELNEYAITDDLNFVHLYYIFLQLYASKPSFTLSSEIMKLEDMLSNQYVIGVHIRLGGPTVGDLDYRHSTSVISGMVTVGKDLCYLHRSVYNSTTGNNSANCTLLVVTDDLGAVEKVQQELNGSDIELVTPSGNIIHIDHRDPMLWQSQSGVIADEVKMFVDWYLLGKRSDALLLSR